MYLLGVRGDFSSAHFLKNYNGKCCNIHGHNWKVEAVFEGHTLDSKTYISEDFGILKKILKNICEELDHTNLNEIEYFKKTNPSAEKISEYIFSQLEKEVIKEKINAQVYEVKVWESDNTWVLFKP
ncbi:MAG: 6-carboxytetrahydropterin synthase [Candidatus Muiribacteriota bacterium]|jgi:6-pyruvoyltetrahydropterin/6-carboxytetrahydropterin synthase